MTTRVTIDAHAGWPVEVQLLQGEPDQQRTKVTEIVNPNTDRTFYIHSGLTIERIRELPLDN